MQHSNETTLEPAERMCESLHAVEPEERGRRAEKRAQELANLRGELAAGTQQPAPAKTIRQG